MDSVTGRFTGKTTWTKTSWPHTTLSLRCGNGRVFSYVRVLVTPGVTIPAMVKGQRYVVGFAPDGALDVVPLAEMG